MAKLYIVATPIGNLEDITLRALNVLKEADLILCEDTRVTKKLLEHYQINKPVESYHQQSKLSKVKYILDLLKQGKNLVLVSDSGTPGISDPGNKLIAQAKELAQIIPVPGPNAAISAASVCGFSMSKFIFLGFPPHKNKRNKFLNEIAQSKYPVILYESPYRIIKTLKDLSKLGDFEIFIARELTKKFETLYRGKINEVINQIEPRGEFVVIIKKLPSGAKSI